MTFSPHLVTKLIIIPTHYVGFAHTIDQLRVYLVNLLTFEGK